MAARILVVDDESYLRDLIRVSDRLSPDAATRTASIGIDGIAA